MAIRFLLRASGFASALVVSSALRADEPATPYPELPGSVTPVVAKVEVAAPALNGAEAFPKMVAEAKAAYAKTRDYSGHIVRQERVGGTLLGEQSGEIRVRTEPFCIHIKMLLPKEASGWEATFLTGSGAKDDRFRFRPAGVAGANGLQTMKATDPKALAGQRHVITDTGIGAILMRTEKLVEVEKKAKNPVHIVAAEYTFEKRPVVRYEIFCERPHPLRYAARVVLFVDKETKLPVRFEAYDAPKPGAAAGDLLECVSFVNLKFNSGLGESTFDK